MATEHRPAALPPRPGQAQAPAGQSARTPLPAGAASWSRTYVDAKGLPQMSEHLVPVDADGRRTEHIRHTCRGKLDDADGRHDCDQVAWLLPADGARFCPHHGGELEPAEKVERKPVLPWRAMWVSQDAALRSWWVLAAELAAGVGEHSGHVPWWAPVAATPLLAGGAYVGTSQFLTRRSLRRKKIEKGQRSGQRIDTIRRRSRAALYSGAAAGGWLTLAAAVDPHSVPGGLAWASLLPVWAVAARPWWRRIEEFKDRPEPEPVPAVSVVEVKPSADELSADDAAQTWATEVAIAGTKLDPAAWKRIACGWQAVIVATKRGALNQLGGDNWKATERRLAAAFDVPKSAVTWIEEHEDSPNKALLLIQPNNPLKEGQIWAGPHLITITESRITADVGSLIDGSRMLETLFRFEEGMPSELVLGTTGSGKSERLRLSLVIQRLASFVDATTGQRKGLFLSFLHDPKRLNSYGEFRNAVHGYGMTRDDAHLMADAFLREMIRRYDMLRTLKWVDGKGRERVGSVKWNPLIHGPLLKGIWDEFHELAEDREFVKKLEKLARYVRACGMGFTLASHMGTIGDTGSQALRDMLSGGRASLLRTTSGLNAALATGGQLTADPRGLPKAPGMVLVADGETATLMGRYSFIPDDKLAERLGEKPLYDWLFDDNNRPIGYPAAIPAETAEAFGREFMEWMEAGRREGGRVDTPAVGTAMAQRAVGGNVKDAVSALRQIMDELGKGGKAVRRKTIAEHPLWTGPGYSITSTLTKAITDAKDAGWLVGSGEFRLSEAAAEQLELELAETAGAR